jgi:uncharacterized protein YbcV (DUF1398 family)
MFTVEQINEAHEKVKSGADFPQYIHDIKQLGVCSFETFVSDSHTEYFGLENFTTSSSAVYETLTIADTCNPEQFKVDLKTHQAGKTDYFAFCKDCAKSGIEKWIVDLNEMTCKYYDIAGNEILTEVIPSV